MAHIDNIDPCVDERWDRFVESHPLGWVTHLSGWKTVMEKSFKHIKAHYLVLIEGNDIVAGLPLYEVRSWLTGNKFVSIPFATLCDPLVSNRSEFQLLFSEVLKYLKKRRVSAFELRTLSASDMIDDERLGVHRYYKHHFIRLLNDPEVLKKSFHRTCVRQKIRRARDCSLNVRVAQSEVDLKDFFRLYLMTRRRLELPSQPYEFFKAIWDVYWPSGKMNLLLAEHEEKAIAGLINFKFKDRVSAEFAASDQAYLGMSPNHLLFWNTIQSACRDGYKVFNFGRTNPTNQDLMDFKRRWGSEMIELSHFYYPKEICEKIDKRESSWKYKLAKSVVIKAPDRAFEFVGKFLYRHI